MIYSEYTLVTSSFGIIAVDRLTVTTSFSFPTYSSAPTGDSTGSAFFNTTDNKFYIYGGTSWVTASGTSGQNGSSGTSGANGSSGISGADGTSGVNGTSGTSGANGTSGTSPTFYTQSIGDNATTSFTITHSLNSMAVSTHMLNGTTFQMYYPTQQTGSAIRGSFHAFLNGTNEVIIRTPWTASTNEFIVVVKS